MGSAKASDRKDAHLVLAAAPLARSGRSAGFDRVQLDHCALPENDLASVNITKDWLGKAVSAPLFIGSMTGGTDHADAINAALAAVAERCGVGLALGSQRAALERGGGGAHIPAGSRRFAFIDGI